MLNSAVLTDITTSYDCSEYREKQVKTSTKLQQPLLILSFGVKYQKPSYRSENTYLFSSDIAHKLQ